MLPSRKMLMELEAWAWPERANRGSPDVASGSGQRALLDGKGELRDGHSLRRSALSRLQASDQAQQQEQRDGADEGHEQRGQKSAEGHTDAERTK